MQSVTAQKRPEHDPLFGPSPVCKIRVARRRQGTTWDLGRMLLWKVLCVHESTTGEGTRVVSGVRRHHTVFSWTGGRVRARWEVRQCVLGCWDAGMLGGICRVRMLETQACRQTCRHGETTLTHPWLLSLLFPPSASQCFHHQLEQRPLPTGLAVSCHITVCLPLDCPCSLFSPRPPRTNELGLQGNFLGLTGWCVVACFSSEPAYRPPVSKKQGKQAASRTGFRPPGPVTGRANCCDGFF